MNDKDELRIRAITWDILLTAMRRMTAKKGLKSTDLTCLEMVKLMDDLEQTARAEYKRLSAAFDCEDD